MLLSRSSVGSRRRTIRNLIRSMAHPLLGRSVWRAALAVALLGGGAPAYAQTWGDTLGNIANKSLADVVTLPARSPERMVTGLGTFAAGVGPVIGSDGTAYLANFDGELRAIRSDGTQAISIMVSPPLTGALRVTTPISTYD
jgi:hypothetical protein